MKKKFHEIMDKVNPGLVVGLSIVALICICAGITMTINNVEEDLEERVDETTTLDVSDIPMEEETVEEIVEPEPEPVVEEPVSYQAPAQIYSYNYNTSGLTPQSGVNWYNDRKETYYSSNVLYHWQTPEWTVGDDGVYRDSDGYVVVAASDISKGETVDTSFGMGKVYDTGCAPGTTDIYTKW